MYYLVMYKMNHNIPTTVELLGNVVQSKNITFRRLGYTILNCFDIISFEHDKWKRFYNSTVIDPDTRKILSVGSPLSYDFELFQKSFPTPLCDEHMIAEEMVEGVSIQLFYDPRTQIWEISTRNSVAGNYAYYHIPEQSSKTYRDMLLDAMGIPGNENRQIEQWAGFKHLLTSNCYHFIVSHPENHLIFQTKVPQLYFTGYYELHGINDVRYRHSSHEPDLFPDGIVKRPKQIQISIQDYLSTISKENEKEKEKEITMGICFLNKRSGERCFIMTPEYKELQQIRGTHPNFMYQYLCLRRIDKIHIFLKSFPQYKPLFSTFQHMFENLIRDIHKAYLHYYIQKSNPVVDKSIFYHIHQIHETIYKPSLNDTVKTIIKKDVVRKYVDLLEPGCTLHLLQREKYKDVHLLFD